MQQKVLLNLKNVHKSYYLSNGEEVPVLKGIDLEIKSHEFVAIMGESGGGKSTLMNIIGCLHSLTAGEYFFEGENIGNVRDDFTLSFIRNRKMGFIFQQFNLLSKSTALRNVSLPGFYAGMSRTKRDTKAKEILMSVGLGERMLHKPTELSGGQQQRVAIARSLMNDPDIILADEPTGALDTVSGKEILDIFLEFKKRGKTVIMVTHDPKVAKCADRIIFLRDGKIIDRNYKLKK